VHVIVQNVYNVYMCPSVYACYTEIHICVLSCRERPACHTHYCRA